MAIDAFAHVVAKYGFTDSVEGVMESVRVMQHLAKDDEQLAQRLISIRKILTPTGAWIKEDAEAQQEDLKKKQLEIDAIRKQEEDAQRAELIAAENVRKAKLRARKIALGLDPAVKRLPILVESPPTTFVTHANRPVHLRVNAQYAQSFQWHANGTPLQDDEEESVQGTRRSTLVINKLSKRVAGEYYCVCENEEGATSTTACQVAIVALSSRRLLSRKLRGLSTSLFQMCWKHTAICCISNAIVVFDTNTFAPVKVLPALAAAGGNGSTQTLAWNPHTKLLVTASSVKSRKNEVALYSLSFTSADADGTPPPKEHRRSLVEAKQKPSSGSAISHLLSTTKVDSLSAIHFAAFFAQGKLLVLSDMKYRVTVFELVPSFSCQHAIDFAGDRICQIASSSSQDAVLAIAFRHKCFLKLFKCNASSPASEQLNFAFPVNCSAFDDRGWFLAVAESSCVKAWISIVNVHTSKTRKKTGTPTKRRFEAHVGKVSCLQWTKATALLVSSGYDGYVKIWEVETAVTCLLSMHMDFRGIHTFVLVDEDAVLLALGYTERRLQSRQLVQLPEFEATRNLELNAHAATIQKIWKGMQTRELIKKYINADPRECVRACVNIILAM